MCYSFEKMNYFDIKLMTKSLPIAKFEHCSNLVAEFRPMGLFFGNDGNSC